MDFLFSLWAKNNPRQMKTMCRLFFIFWDHYWEESAYDETYFMQIGHHVSLCLLQETPRSGIGCHKRWDSYFVLIGNTSIFLIWQNKDNKSRNAYHSCRFSLKLACVFGCFIFCCCVYFDGIVQEEWRLFVGHHPDLWHIIQAIASLLWQADSVQSKWLALKGFVSKMMGSVWSSLLWHLMKGFQSFHSEQPKNNCFYFLHCSLLWGRFVVFILLSVLFYKTLWLKPILKSHIC